MTPKFLKSKPGLALFGASGLVAVAAFAGTTMISHAASPAPAAATEAPGAEKPEAAETPEANEPALPGGGHIDEAPGASESTTDHQFNGVE